MSALVNAAPVPIRMNQYSPYSNSYQMTESTFTLSSKWASTVQTSSPSSYMPLFMFAFQPSYELKMTTPVPHMYMNASSTGQTTYSHLNNETKFHHQSMTAAGSEIVSNINKNSSVTNVIHLTSTASAWANMQNYSEDQVGGSSLEQSDSSSMVLDNFDAYLTFLSVDRNILIGLVLGTIAIFTVLGNSMVIWAIFNYRPLHIVQNMFLVSLAVSDIAVAVLVMPFNVAYNWRGKWYFGLHLCEMWLTSDVLCCTASILNLCAIALDRYWAIHDPINYAQKRTMRRVVTSICIVWILSAIISIPPLIGWNDWPDEFNENTPCKLSEEKSYLIYSSSGSFYIPLLIMTVVYFKIFKATKRRLKDRAKASAMANLGRNAVTITTVSTPTIQPTNNNNLTKFSSNEDSSSSGSPKAHSKSLVHIRSHCVRCCFFGSSKSSNHMEANVTHHIDKVKSGKIMQQKKAFKNSLKEARVEIESVSEDFEHSRNEISSSDACGGGGNGGNGNGGGFTSGTLNTIHAESFHSQSQCCNANCEHASCQQASKNKSPSSNESPRLLSAADSTTVVPAATAAAATVTNGCYCASISRTKDDDAVSSTPMVVSFANALTVHTSSTTVNNNDWCVQPGESKTSGTFTILNAVPIGSQNAYVCNSNIYNNSNGEQQQQQCISLQCSSSKPIVYTESNDDINNLCLKVMPNVEQVRTKNEQEMDRDSDNREHSENGHSNGATFSTQLTTYSPCSSQVATMSPSNMMIRTELSCNTTLQHKPTLTNTIMSQASANNANNNLNRTIQIPLQAQVSVKKIWEEKQKISLSRERRATRILGIVMGVFVLCWLPFFLMYLIVPFCDSCNVSPEVANFITWLGYINSSLNPLIYAGFNRDFRRAFTKILSCKHV